MLNLNRARDAYISRLAFEFQMDSTLISEIYDALIRDGFIDYDIEKELLLDE